MHQFYPDTFHGTERFVWQLAEAVQRSGQTVAVLTGYQKKIHWRHRLQRLLPWVQRNRYVYQGLPVERFARVRLPWNRWDEPDPQLRRVALDVLRREHPDLLHIGHALRMQEFVDAAQALGIPYLITLTDFWLVCPRIQLVNADGQACAGSQQGAECARACPQLPSGWTRRHLAWASQALQTAARVVAPSLYVARTTQSMLPGTKIEVIPHGLAPALYHADQTAGSALAPGIFTFAYAGALTPSKGVHVLVEAFRQLEDDRARLRIHGGGTPEYLARLRTLAGADPRIFFDGPYPPPEAINILRRADVAVFPSLWSENSPFVVLEAQAAGTPVIAADGGGLREKVLNGVTGLLVRQGDGAALRETMGRLLHNPPQAAALRQQVQARPLRTAGDEAADYLRLYQAVLARPVPGVHQG